MFWEVGHECLIQRLTSPKDWRRMVRLFKKIRMLKLQEMEVDVKNWDFSVGKTEKKHAVEISVKLGIKPKAKL
jgi:hypothetical protein